jgi:hypothetical protein
MKLPVNVGGVQRSNSRADGSPGPCLISRHGCGLAQERVSAALACDGIFTRSMEAELGIQFKSAANLHYSYADVVQREPHVPREMSSCSPMTSMLCRRKVRFADSVMVVPFQVGSPPSVLGRANGPLQPFVSYFQPIARSCFSMLDSLPCADDMRYST